MTLTYKGAYNAETDYDQGDVVLFTDNVWYVCTNDIPAAGNPCTDTLRWERADAVLAMAAGLVKDIDIAVEAKTVPLPTAPSDDGTYTLNATFDDGEVSYAWTAVEAAGGK